MPKITVAIDGYSSCGKSTLAKALAVKLQYSYIDSGAMYRCITWFCIDHGIIINNSFSELDVIKALPFIKVGFDFNPHTKSTESFINGENVEKHIRTMNVSSNVSAISAIKEVREKMVAMQREMGKAKGVVMDGRDIGTHVFPNAELKLFMTADIDVRAQRRQDELWAKGEHVTVEEVKKNLADRDYADTTRKESPLIKAADAIILDNSDLSREEQLDYVLKLIQDLQLQKD